MKPNQPKGKMQQSSNSSTDLDQKKQTIGVKTILHKTGKLKTKGNFFNIF